MSPSPDALDDAAQYGKHYFDYLFSDSAQRKAMYFQEAARLKARAEGRSVLDIGCGVGAFLQCLDHDFVRYGYDPSPYARERAAERGVNVLPDLAEVTDDCMDVVVFRGTLQHISRPMETLSQAARILRPGGLLAALATPDTDSLVYFLWGRLPALEAPRNWVLFGGRMLRNILRRLGFERFEILHPYWGSPYARPIVDFSKFALSLFFGYRKFAFPGNMMELYCRKVKPIT